MSHVFIGGVAVSFSADPRMTRDIDALVVLAETSLESFLGAAAAHGIVPRVRDAREFAARHNVLLLSHTPSDVTVDISLAVLPFEKRAVERAREVTVAGMRLRVLRPEDLIVMKSVAHRAIDLRDVARIVAANPDLDRKHILDELRPFAEALDSPHIVEEVERMLNQGGRTQSR